VKPYELYIAYVSWTAPGENSGKYRPVIVLSQNNNIISTYKITTRYTAKSKYIQSQYFPINDWRQAGLNKPSYIDTIEIKMFNTDDFINIRPIGLLSTSDIIQFQAFLANKD
jgi:hypothetical protein